MNNGALIEERDFDVSINLNKLLVLVYPHLKMNYVIKHTNININNKTSEKQKHYNINRKSEEKKINCIEKRHYTQT